MGDCMETLCIIDGGIQKLHLSIVSQDESTLRLTRERTQLQTMRK